MAKLCMPKYRYLNSKRCRLYRWFRCLLDLIWVLPYGSRSGEPAHPTIYTIFEYSTSMSNSVRKKQQRPAKQNTFRNHAVAHKWVESVSRAGIFESVYPTRRVALIYMAERLCGTQKHHQDCVANMSKCNRGRQKL